jgi:threonylcarbamoyladenosine tRNA methylthiotransferase CDKAL1
MKNKIYIETYGCTANRNDSQIMAGVLEESKFNLTSLEEADHIIINSCGVKSSTEEKIIHNLERLSKMGKSIIIAGCLTKINPERIKKTIPNFSAMLDTKSIDKMGDVIKEINKGKTKIIKFSKISKDKTLLPHVSSDKIINIIQVSEGCLSNCSFCGTKLARGNLKSYRPENIRESIRKSITSGIKEIYLTSQDMSAYGRDIGTNLTELLNSITEIEGDFMIRVGMMNPLHLNAAEIENLIKIFKNKNVFNFLHLCLQSGSNNVLKIMKRGYKAEDFVYYIEQFRKEIPNITLWTDIIVGHPGENKEHFNESLEIIKKIKPDFVNISSYGNRVGTEATKMKQISTKIKKLRTRKISKIVKNLSLENNKKWIGWEGYAIVDEYNKEKNNFIARNISYKPIVIKNKNVTLGDFVKIKIIDAKETCLISR